MCSTALLQRSAAHAAQAILLLQASAHGAPSDTRIGLDPLGYVSHVLHQLAPGGIGLLRYLLPPLLHVPEEAPQRALGPSISAVASEKRRST